MVLGLGLMIPQIVMLATIPVFVWIVAVSIYMLIRPNLATEVSEPAGVMSARPAGMEASFSVCSGGSAPSSQWSVCAAQSTQRNTIAPQMSPTARRVRTSAGADSPAGGQRRRRPTATSPQ